MTIDHYSFGRMVVDGKEYNSDLIVFPEKVVSNWWRKEGHLLDVSDIKEVISFLPEVLVVGKGASGAMNISKEVICLLREKKIKLVAEPTGKAVKEYNRLRNTRAVGAFHLTC